MKIPKAEEGLLTKILVYDGARRVAEAAVCDVAIAGGGPAGLTLAWLLAKDGYKVTLVEHYLGLGGGMRGGASLLPSMLVEDGLPAELLRKAGVKLNRVEEVDGLYTIDPVEASVSLAYNAVRYGARVLVGWHVEDLIIKTVAGRRQVRGLVIVLSPTVEAGWHVDPIYVEAKAVVDATGHDGQLLRILERRIPGSIKVPGMSAMDVWNGEQQVVEKTGEVYPGLYVTGMSVAEAYNTPRMGPVFGGMIASAWKLYNILKNRLEGRS
jgi:thiamine thiazole synthase